MSYRSAFAPLRDVDICDPPSHATLLRQYLKSLEQRREELLEQEDGALLRNTKLALLTFQMARLYYNIGIKYESESRHLVLDSLDADPTSIPTNLLLMDIYSRKGRFDRTLDVANNSIFNQQLSQVHSNALGRSFIKLNVRMGVHNEMQGEDVLAQRLYADAGHLVDTICRRDTNEPFDNIVKSATFAAQGRFEEARLHVEDIPAGWENDIRARLATAVKEAETNRPRFLKHFKHLNL